MGWSRKAVLIYEENSDANSLQTKSILKNRSVGPVLI